MTHLLTPDDAAERLAVTGNVVRQWLREGKIKGVRLGRLWRIHPEALETFLEKGFAQEPPKRKPRKPTTAKPPKPKTRQKSPKGHTAPKRPKRAGTPRRSRTGAKRAQGTRRRARTSKRA
jgi:excisionase family DNA binding protein